MKTATLPSLTVCRHCNQYPSFLFAPAGPGRRPQAGTRTRGRVGCFFSNLFINDINFKVYSIQVKLTSLYSNSFFVFNIYAESTAPPTFIAGGKGAGGGGPDVCVPRGLRLCCAGRALGVGLGSICCAQRNWFYLLYPTQRKSASNPSVRLLRCRQRCPCSVVSWQLGVSTARPHHITLPDPLLLLLSRKRENKTCGCAAAPLKIRPRG